MRVVVDIYTRTFVAFFQGDFAFGCFAKDTTKPILEPFHNPVGQQPAPVVG